MKISNKQLILLFEIAKDSLISDSPVYSMKKEVRKKLVEDIINQQGEKLKEVGE
ncbi:MAG: hypothetical protein PHQ35_09430 [Phycisphaerae bacterium]|nr:hypothetical protein [Phycisphaerae bacterium]MDD5239938.1 hypothetical protein [Candidatus Nanoarchaeia archaeon]